MKKFLLAFAVLVATLCCQQLAAQTQINQSNIGSFPYSITKPGSYILTSNLVVSTAGTNAIYILANNVVLNLNGFSISGPFACTGATCNSTTPTYGIYGYGTGQTVENGSVSGFFWGIDLEQGTVHDMQLSSCSYCIYVNGAIHHNTIIGSAQYGIYAQGSVISDNVIFSAYGTAIYCLTSSVTGNSVFAPTGVGIQSDYSSTLNNMVNSASTYGISAWESYIGGNTIYGSGTSDLTLSESVSTKNNACTGNAC